MGAPMSKRRILNQFNQNSGEFMPESSFKHSLDHKSRQVKIKRASKKMISLMNWKGAIDASGYRFESHYR